MNDWNMPLDYSIEKTYYSSFNSAANYDEFCKKNLVKLKAPSDYIKADKLRLKTRNKSNRPKIKANIKKWEVYVSEINLINDIVLLSEVLRHISVNKRNECLSQFIKIINTDYNPIYFNYPFDDSIVSCFTNDNCIKYLKNIHLEYCFCLSTKEHVPYHLLLELSNNNHKVTNHYKPNNTNEVKNTSNNTLINQTNIPSSSSAFTDSNKANSSNAITQGIGRFFTFSYYINSFSSIFQCVRPEITNSIDDPNGSSLKSNNINTDKWIINTLSPDSIGLFGKKSYNQIKQELIGNDHNNQLLPIIIKGGEDLRQDYFVSQATSLFLSIFQRANIDIFLQPLQILATGKGGIMKTLPDTTSLMKINKVNYSQFEGFSSSTFYIDPEIDRDNLTKSSLRNYFVLKYGKDTDEFNRALNRFIQSLAGYSLLCYFLEIKDRNNGNILINDKGYLIHIDFGFLLGKSPGNVNLEQAPFKLTWDFVELMMGVKSKYFDTYRELMVKGLIALRKEYKAICGFVKIFIETNADLLCFNDKELILRRLKDKFYLHILDDKEIAEKVNMLIFTSLDNWRTLVYDQFQKFCVGIN